MATTREYADAVCMRLVPFGDVRSRKMFGEYVIYVNEKPIFTVCDNTVFVKKLPAIESLMTGAPCGIPYEGAKEAYRLDLDNEPLLAALVPLLLAHTPLPKPRKRR